MNKHLGDILQNLALLLVPSLILSCSDSSSSSSNESITITGTLQVSTEVTNENGVTTGEPISGAQVFVRGFSQQTAETNSLGEFILNVDLSQGRLATSTALNSNYELFMWYTVTNNSQELSTARFGAAQFVIASAGDSVSVATVNLVYTKGIHVFLYDAVATTTPLTGCTINIPGLESQVVSQEVGNGGYNVDYLPASDYTLEINCTGYNPVERSVTIAQGSNSDDWDSYNYYLDAN